MQHYTMEGMMKSSNNRLKSATRSFLAELKSEAHSSIEQTRSYLFARGYRLKSNDMELSQASHPRDFQELKNTLSGYQLGDVASQRILIEAPSDSQGWVPWFLRRAQCAYLAPEQKGSLQVFLEDCYPQPLPAFDLDPYISNLVQSFSEIGVRVRSGCDGHGIANPHVRFQGIYNSVWSELILENFLSRSLRESLHYKFWKNMVVFYFDASAPEKCYLSMHQAAKVIEKRKDWFVSMKRRVASSLKNENLNEIHGSISKIRELFELKITQEEQSVMNGEP